MSKNALVTINAINAALSVSVRDFSSVLFITDKFDIEDIADNNPIAITNVNKLKDFGIAETDDEYIIVRDYFGASPKPDLIWIYGSTTQSYSDMLSGLDERWNKNWFYTLSPFVDKIKSEEIGNALKGLSSIYLLLMQGLQNLSIEDNLEIPQNIKLEDAHYTASDTKEGEHAGLIGTIRTFFPGQLPFAAIKLNGLKGCKYSIGERLKLVGTEETSMTGVNIVHEESRLVVPYYGKSTDGVTWFDYAAARAAIDEYLLVGVTKYIVERNTSGFKMPANDKGALSLIAEADKILEVFIDKEIIYGKGDIDEDGNSLYQVKVSRIIDRTAFIEYQCVYQGAIIKSEVQISLTSRGGN